MNTQRERNKNRLKILWIFLRIIIGAGLIAFLLIKLNAGKILHHIKSMDIKYLLIALIPYFFFIVVSAWRWQVLLNYKKMGMPFRKTLLVYFIAMFFNNLLPTTVGGDIMRIFYAPDNRRTDALAIILADRILGFIGLFLFGILAVGYLYIFQKRTEFVSLMVIGLVILIIITFTLFSERVYALFAPIMNKLRILKLGEKINNLHRTMTDFGTAREVITLCIILSIVIQLLLAISPYFVLKSMGNFQISILPFFIYLPIINIISMIPISFNALGVRENAYVLFFRRAGLTGEISMTVSLISFFLVFLWSLLGGIIFIFYRKKTAEGGL